MIKLLDILKEAMEPKDKMIIMAGAAGSGKSTLISKIKSATPGFEIINPDKYVEDKDSPMYNNLAQSSMQVDDKDVPEALANHKSFILLHEYADLCRADEAKCGEKGVFFVRQRFLTYKIFLHGLLSRIPLFLLFSSLGLLISITDYIHNQ
jgi:predicted ATPase